MEIRNPNALTDEKDYDSIVKEILDSLKKQSAKSKKSQKPVIRKTAMPEGLRWMERSL